MKVKAPSERNFRRPRKRTRRSRFRLRVSAHLLRRLLMVALLVFGTYQSVSLAFTTPLLRVQTIAVRGNARLSSGQVQALVADLQGSSILRLDLDDFRRRLIESPWVADAAIRRLLPSTVEVFVSERRPVGLCRLGQDLYLVDETGAIIDQFGPQYAEFDLPIIDGLSGGDSDAADARAALAGRVLADFQRRPDLARLVSQVDVSNVSDAVVILKNDPALIHTGDDQFVERIQSYLDLGPRLREGVPRIDSVDLRFGERVYVKPQGTSGK
jgi:cell division septal protein FtsQ